MRRHHLLGDLLTLLSEDEVRGRRSAHFRYLSRLMGLCHCGWALIERDRRQRLLSSFRLGSNRKILLKMSVSLQQLKDAHIFYALLAARTEGRLPAWEGIRIVRERIPVGERDNGINR